MKTSLDAPTVSPRIDASKGMVFAAVERVHRRILVPVSTSGLDLNDPDHRLPDGRWSLDPYKISEREFNWGVVDVVGTAYSLGLSGWTEDTIRKMAMFGLIPAIRLTRQTAMRGRKAGESYRFRSVDVKAAFEDGALLAPPRRSGIKGRSVTVTFLNEQRYWFSTGAYAGERTCPTVDPEE